MILEIVKTTRLMLAGIAAMATAVSIVASSQPLDVDSRLRAIDQQVRSGQFVEAEAAARQLIGSLESIGAAATLDMANALDRLVEAMVDGHNDGGQLIGPAERAVALKEQLLGPDDPERWRSLINLARVEDARSRFPSALAAAELGLSLARRAWPADDERVVWALTWVAFQHYRAGDYPRAEAEYHTVIDVAERTFPANDPRLGRAYHGWGLLLGVLGRHDEARSAFERGMRIREAAYGPNSLVVAQSANGLGNVLANMGELAAAREALGRALAIRERGLPPTHRLIGQTVRLYGQLLEQLGDYDGARTALERAVAIFGDAADAERALASFRYARILGRLGRSGQAREWFERAVPMMVAAYGPRHPFVAQSLSDYAYVLEDLGERPAALAQATRALEIRRQMIADHPAVMTSLRQIARLQEALGDRQSPRALYEEMLRFYERGATPFEPSGGYVDYANYLLRAGERTSAFDQAILGERLGRLLVRQTVRALPEREAVLFTSSHRSALEVALTIAEQASPLSPHATERLFDAVVGSRAMVLDEMGARRRAVAETPAIATLRHEVDAARARLAHIVVRGHEDLPRGEYLRLIAQASEQKDHAEARLARESAPFRVERQNAAAGVREVRAALPEGSALVSFVTYRTPRAGTRYAALVLRASGEPPRFIALGAAANIDAAVDATRAQLLREATAPGVSPIRAEQRYRESASVLRRLVWDALAPAVGASRRLFIVGDGALHLINFSALPDGAGRYLIDRGLAIHYLSAERDLVTGRMRQNGGLLAVGNPSFDYRVPTTSIAAAAVRDGQRGAASECAGLDGMRFDALPAAAAEAGDVARLWGQLAARSPDFGPSVRLNRGDATEAAFKSQAPGQRVLHLATHGFALLDGCRDRSDRSWPRQVLQNPLLLSGLALAGANQRQLASSANEDGILTAEEIASLDLDGVEWAVLSACGTGLGTIQAGEGVFGLRRAFRIAGAATVIMSLWPIDDVETRRWVDTLYRARFVDRLSTLDAVRQSSVTALQRQRQAGASTHPYYWAGFVAAGDWR